MSKALTTGAPWRVLLVFVVPLFIGNVIQQLYQLTDAMVVGRVLGVDALAAVGATGSFIFLLVGFAWGMTSGFAIPTAQAFGAGDARAVRRSVAAGSILTAAVSLLVTVAAPLLTGPALRLLRTPEELVPQATTFAVVTFLGTATTMFFNYLAAVLRAIGDSRTPLVFLVVACGLNIVLVLVAVPGLGLGVGGAALATVVAQAVSVALTLDHIRRRVPELRVRREDWDVTPAELRHHLHLGVPMGFQASIIALGMIAVQVRLNSLGSDAVAAFTTAVRVDHFAMALLNSLGIAVSMYAAQNLGARRPDRIRTGVRQALWMSVVGSAVVGTVVAIAGSSLVRLFVGPGEDDVVRMAAYFLLVNGGLYVVLGGLFVLRGALQGLGYTAVPTITGLLELVCRVGAAVVLGAVWGFEGVVWGNPLAWIAAMTVLIPAYVRARRALERREPVVGAVQPAVVVESAVAGGAAEEVAVLEAGVAEAEVIRPAQPDPARP
ncbi:MATE family efflux transporter [Cellulomonas sp. APG4]|uniref:MATE family efflux transporter n=1 Tax=Cellulomonas sp. APG4 TaxID=1538656 RepID=UPI001379A502|nr:MATE family efflux transporter [Cellulomonas sp. APG4]NCT90503.1 MATE family efflux transporter [Cellulomonas sp. APG4]